MKKEENKKKTRKHKSESAKNKVLLLEILKYLYARKFDNSIESENAKRKVWGSNEKKPDSGTLGEDLQKSGFPVSRRCLSHQLGMLVDYFKADAELSEMFGIFIDDGIRGKYVLKTRFSAAEIEWIKECLDASPSKGQTIENYPDLRGKLIKYQAVLSGKHASATVEEISGTYREYGSDLSRETNVAKEVTQLIKKMQPFSAEIRLPNDELFGSRFGDFYLPIDILISSGHYYVLAIAFTVLSENAGEPCIVAAKDIRSLRPISLGDNTLSPHGSIEELKALSNMAKKHMESLDIKQYLAWHPSLNTTDLLECTFVKVGIRCFKWNETAERAFEELASVINVPFQLEPKHNSWGEQCLELSGTLQLEENYAMEFAIKYASVLKLVTKANDSFTKRLQDRILIAEKVYS